MVVFLLKICIKDDCKNDNGVPNCMVVVTLMFSTCLPPLFHFASMSLQKLVSTLKGGSEKSAEKSVFFFFYSTSSFLFLFSSIVVFFFGDGVFSPLSLSNSSKFYSLKKHACNEEASLQCYLNIVMYNKYSNCKHCCYNQLHAPGINARVYTIETKAKSNFPLITIEYEHGCIWLSIHVRCSGLFIVCVAINNNDECSCASYY